MGDKGLGIRMRRRLRPSVRPRCEQLKITIAESVAHDRKVGRHFSCALSEQRRRDNGGFVFVEAFGQFATRTSARISAS